MHTLAEFNRMDGPPDAIAHGYLVNGPVSLLAADASGDEPSVRCEGLLMSLLGTAAPATSACVHPALEWWQGPSLTWRPVPGARPTDRSSTGTDCTG